MIKRYNYDYAYIHADDKCAVLPTPHATLFSRLTAFIRKLK